jgi:hypothetical protein
MHNLPPHILAWYAGNARGDAVAGTSLLETPDIEGLTTMEENLAEIVAESHYDLMENWDNAQWIQHDACNFHHTPHGPFSPSSSSGPSFTDILKQITAWDKLSDLSPTGWLRFYNKLRRLAGKWKVALMPFEAIDLRYKFQGHCLCICRVGLLKWKKWGTLFFSS